jgi:inosine-uridine nucleoside N-ribohydrolase
MTPEEVARLDAAPTPLAKMVSVCTKRWMERHPGNHPHLYDPVAIAAMMQPDLCTWATGTVKIDNAGGPADGVSVLHRNADGKHRVQMDVNREAAVNAILDQLCGAQKAAAR